MDSTMETSIGGICNKIAEHGLIVFAGAGVSADMPSQVPGWFALNGMIIEALKYRVTEYLGRDPKWLDQITKGVVGRRDAHKFPPEYQAQIMEEQCGEDYFRALATVDVSQQNRSHAAIAVLTRAGYLRAVVTTNFDCLIESALQAEKVGYESFIDIDDYCRLRDNNPPILSAPPTVPVVKIHGSAKKPSSMIDTLQQRLVGRGKLLVELLNALLSRHVVLYVGFSAADLNHNRDYLGLRRSAIASPGAVFVQYPGSSLEPGAKSLLDAYGQKAYHIEAVLSDTFSQVLASLNLDIPEEPSIVDPDPRETVATKLNSWAKSLQPYEAINMLSALFDACGEEEASWNLLHRTWKSRLSSDSKGEQYARYQYNYASHCVQSGEMLYEETPQNFFRSLDTVPQSRAGFTLWSLYRAKPDDFWPFLLQIKARAHDQKDPRLLGDIMFVFAQAAVIYRWTENLDDIMEAGNYQRQIGDLPRALKLWAVAARLAGQSGDLGTVNGLFNHCEPSFDYLGDDTCAAEFHLAYAMAGRKRGSASVGGNLGMAMPVMKRYQRWPLWIEALIEGTYYYFAEGQAAEARQLVEEASQRIAKGYEIYYPHLGIAVAEYHLGVNQWERAARELNKVRPLAELSNNSWAVSTIDSFLNRIDEAISDSRP